MESRMRSKVACTVREGAGYFANPPISSQDMFNKGRLAKKITFLWRGAPYYLSGL